MLLPRTSGKNSRRKTSSSFACSLASSNPASDLVLSCSINSPRNGWKKFSNVYVNCSFPTVYASEACNKVKVAIIVRRFLQNLAWAWFHSFCYWFL